MSTIHFIFQGKGGVGKTIVSAQVSQRLIELGLDVKCLNVDPVNQTFNRYKALKVTNAKIIEPNGTITDEFDETISQMLADDAHYVIDTGASTFSPLVTYIFENQIIELLNQGGKTIFFHIPINGGPGQKDTLTGLKDILSEFGADKINFIVWENRFFGDITLDGKTFKEMKIYSDNKDRIHHVISFGEQKNLFTKNFLRLNTDKLTYDEAANADDYSLMEKHRLVMIKREIFSQIDSAIKCAEIGV